MTTNADVTIFELKQTIWHTTLTSLLRLQRKRAFKDVLPDQCDICQPCVTRHRRLLMSQPLIRERQQYWLTTVRAAVSSDHSQAEYGAIKSLVSSGLVRRLFSFCRFTNYSVSCGTAARP